MNPPPVVHGRWGLLAIVSAAVASGCGSDPAVEGPADRPPMVVRDSAGIAIIENPSPFWGPGQGWAIDPEPLLQIGAVDGEDAYQFSRPHEGFLLPNGRVVVVERRIAEIRIFSPDGLHLTSFGRLGEGPGEFGTAPNVWPVGQDSLLALDPRGRRLTWFDTEGNVLGERPTTTFPPRPIVILGNGGTMGWSPTRDGSMVGTRPVFFGGGVEIGSPNESPDEYQIRRIFSVVNPTHATVVEIQDTLPFTTWIAGARVEWDPEGHATLIDDPPRVVATGWWEWQVAEYGSDGTVARIIRAAVPRIPGPEAVDSLEAHFEGMAFDGAPEASDSLPAIAYQQEFGGAQPTIASDGGGHLWVRRASYISRVLSAQRGTFRIHRRTGPIVFDVVDPDGRWLGPVEFDPALGRIMDITPDRIVTEWTDSLDVPFIRVYRIASEGG